MLYFNISKKKSAPVGKLIKFAVILRTRSILSIAMKGEMEQVVLYGMKHDGLERFRVTFRLGTVG